MGNIGKTVGLVGTLVLLGVVKVAYAGPITLTPEDCDTSAEGNCVTSDQNNQPSLEQWNTWLGEEGLEELYKNNFGGGESGEFKDDYDTAFFNTESDPEYATISWGGPDSIDCPVCYVWVKDGNASPNIYIFDIGDWDGTSSIFLRGFFAGGGNEGGGAISNVGILGKSGGDTQISEPATLGLLGLGLVAVGFARRRPTAA